MSESLKVATPEAAVVQYTLDGKDVTLLELNEIKNKSSVKVVETAPGMFKTLKRLNG